MQIYRILRTPTLAATPSTSKLHSKTNFSRGRYLVLSLMLLLLNQVKSSQSDWLMDCGDCHCKWNSGKKTADCRNLSLSSVPENLSSELQVLDLSLNHIPYLEENAFLSGQLQNLHKLYIRNCSVQNIDPRSFNSLEILIELDLSNNLLRTLKPNLFARLVKVRALVLNGNQLESLGEGIFQNLKYLHKIELKNNRISRIGSQVFMAVPLLTQIYLDGNRLSFLRKESFETLKRLTALSLDQNPWNCTCELQIFRDFVLKRNLYTPPTACYYPTNLRGMLWVEEQPEAFACKPRIIYPSRGASINTSKENVTLICRVHASPNTIIVWDYNKQMYRPNVVNGGQQRVHIQLLRDEQSKEKEFGRDLFISRLTILGADKSDEGIYTCLAENAGGKDAVQMNLLVQKPEAKDLLLQGNMIIVIGLMALGLLSASVFLAMVTCCIYKRFKAINAGHRRHHHLDVGEAMATTADSTTTPVAGVTSDVVLGVTVNSVTANPHHNRHYNNIHHNNMHQKTKLNGSADNGVAAQEKYSEAIKHGLTIVDNGSLGGTGHQLLLSNSQLNRVENAYLEKKHDDSLHIKYPQAQPLPELNRILANSSCQRFQSTGEVGSGSDYQPDLLPLNDVSSSAQQRELNMSTITNVTTRTINQQQQLNPENLSVIQGRQQTSKSFGATTSLQTALKSKYNANTQGYLKSRLTTHNNNVAAVTSAVAGSVAVAGPKQMKSSKREMPSIPLTSSTSLLTPATTPSFNENPSATTTLQRHSKSLALPQRIATPTESSYEYRQPPPPPYYSRHRTSIKDAGEQCKDLGYRDSSNTSETETLQHTDNTLTRHTFVSASPSLNYINATEYTPRRQLL